MKGKIRNIRQPLFKATAEQLTTTKVANIAFTHLLLSNEHIPVLEIFADSQSLQNNRYKSILHIWQM